MKHEHRPIRFIVAGLVIVGLLIAGNAIQSAAWTQGYTMGLLTSGADSADLAPYLLYRSGPGMQSGVGFFGGILRIGFLLLAALGIFKLLGFAYYRRHGGPPPWMQHHGPCWGSEEDRPEGPAGDTPVTESDTPQSPAPVSG